MSEDVFYRTSHRYMDSWFELEARQDGRIDIRFGPGSIPAVMALVAAWAGPTQVAIVQSVMTVARVKRIRFFNDGASALVWARE